MTESYPHQKRYAGSEQTLADALDVSSERNRPPAKLRGLVGAAALFVGFSDAKADVWQAKFDGLRARLKTERQQEKEEQAYAGSLNEIRDTIVPLEEEYHLPPHRLQPEASADEPGVYRSHHATETAEPAEEHDDLMERAAQEARRKLGQIPLQVVLQEETAEPGLTPAEVVPTAAIINPGHPANIVAHKQPANAVSPSEGSRQPASPEPALTTIPSTERAGRHRHPGRGKHRAPASRPFRRGTHRDDNRRREPNPDLTSTNGK